MPLVLSVSALEPASIQTPTVDVWAHGECSVAIYAFVQQCKQIWSSGFRTVRPFERVVLSVFMPLWIGVAKPLLIGEIEFRAVRLRKAWLRLSASRREAIAVGYRAILDK